MFQLFQNFLVEMNIQHLFPYSPGKYKKLTKGKEKQQPKKPSKMRWHGSEKFLEPQNELKQKPGK